MRIELVVNRDPISMGTGDLYILDLDFPGAPTLETGFCIGGIDLEPKHVYFSDEKGIVVQLKDYQVDPGRDKEARFRQVDSVFHKYNKVWFTEAFSSIDQWLDDAGFKKWVPDDDDSIRSTASPWDGDKLPIFSTVFDPTGAYVNLPSDFKLYLRDLWDVGRKSFAIDPIYNDNNNITGFTLRMIEES